MYYLKNNLRDQNYNYLKFYEKMWLAFFKPSFSYTIIYSKNVYLTIYFKILILSL